MKLDKMKIWFSCLTRESSLDQPDFDVEKMDFVSVDALEKIIELSEKRTNESSLSLESTYKKSLWLIGVLLAFDVFLIEYIVDDSNNFNLERFKDIWVIWTLSLSILPTYISTCNLFHYNVQTIGIEPKAIYTKNFFSKPSSDEEQHKKFLQGILYSYQEKISQNIAENNVRAKQYKMALRLSLLTPLVGLFLAWVVHSL